MFCWDKLLCELEENAPVLLATLRVYTDKKAPTKSNVSHWNVCCHSFEVRYSKMSLAQKIISIILYGGHSGKLVSLKLD